MGGAAVCTLSGTTSELNVEDFFRQNRLDYNPSIFESADIALDAYGKGACDVFTTDRSALAGLRTSLPNPGEHVILPEVISEEPLTPLVPHGDSQWFDIVKSVMGILIHAEALGVNSGNVAQMTTSDSPRVKRMLGAEGSWGQADLGRAFSKSQNSYSKV